MTETTKCSRPRCERVAHRHGLCQRHIDAHPDHGRTPAAIAHKHILRCLGTGATVKGIALGVGLNDTTIYRLLKRENPTISLRTHRALMAATPAMDHRGQLLAWPYARRLRSLRAANWTTTQLAAATGLHRDSLLALMNNKWTVLDHRKAAAIRDTFTACGPRIQPRNPRDKNPFRNHPTPAAWDNIDDPGERHNNEPRQHYDHRTLTEGTAA